ncbi:hypothetical protein DYB32_009313 [Aphanomyces invadans]|uniref:Uncharacterized protein n=1 Tax=Aphanomyces invadans TaxID=157072 RepID=A0A418AIJ7_9STRA|nr:hypothetical protein DYB32_009313 [Aphanomyces invadans]
MRSRLHVHVDSLAKDPAELNINGNGEQFGKYPPLLDKGHYRVADHIIAKYLKKKPVGGYLDADDDDCNRCISADCVLMENFFGLACPLWKISYATSCWSQNVYYGIQRHPCSHKFFLTIMPLRGANVSFYRYALPCYEKMAHDKVEENHQLDYNLFRSWSNIHSPIFHFTIIRNMLVAKDCADKAQERYTKIRPRLKANLSYDGDLSRVIAIGFQTSFGMSICPKTFTPKA